MPIREYECKDCKKEFEYLHHGSDDIYAECVHCNAKETKQNPHEKKFPTSTSHILKGRGWYKDGY